MKKLLFFVLLFFIPVLFVKANSISSISMDIFIDDNGDALVTETWNANVNSGTEGYHPYFNVGNSNFIMESASMDGESYEIIYDWDINKSLSEKAYKAGIYKTGNEIDLCYGLSSYGMHTYEFKYKITNFVLGLADADMVYWTLFPYDFSAIPNNVYIKIYSNFEYNSNLDVWGYGNYGGTAYVYDGYIEMNSPDTLSKDQYMTILVKFPKGTFNTTNISNNEFEYYHNMANEGSKRYKNKKGIKTLAHFVEIICQILLYGIPVIIGVIVAINYKRTRDIYDFGITGNKIRDDVPNFRDIPCNKDLFRAYFIANKYNISTKKENMLGALLLKWLKDGNVKVEKIEKQQFFGPKIIDNIIFIKRPENIELEKEMYDWMYEASKDGKLEENEFKKWCKKSYSAILNWFDDIIDYEQKQLINEGKIKIEVDDTKHCKTTRYVVDPSLMLEAENLQGLKKYLKEFTLIKEKEPIEVHLWNEYLIFAQMFGIAKEVAKQFEKLYPEISKYMSEYGYDYNTMYFLYNVSNTGMKSANSAKARAESYSSGGGGFSSGGGGGGSFGGGGGGGGFR